MNERFEGRNRPQLIAALRRQDIATGSAATAEALAAAGQLVEFGPGENIVEQGGQDNDIYLLVAGAVAIVVNGAQLAVRKAGEFVGEMAARRGRCTA